MISASDARLLTAKAKQEFYDRAVVRSTFLEIEDDIKMMAIIGQSVLRYEKDKTQRLLGAFEATEFNMIRDRLESFGFNTMHHKQGEVFDFFTVSWEASEE